MVDYEKYRKILSETEFYKDWSAESLNELTTSLKNRIYERYVVKATCFQRDNFECQNHKENEQCKNTKKLTLHHIKWQKNGGQHKPKNCITLCHSCHHGYHNGSNNLSFWGATYKLNLEPKIDWNEIRSWAREVRKNNKEYHGVIIPWEILVELMKWLTIPYDEMELDDE